jgi:prepilin-type N-terminal cleavage/methylation domain-containing protein
MIKRVQNSSRSGFTLIEMLVVMFVFSTLAVLATQSIALTLRGSRKSEAMSEVRSNVEYAMNVMERLLHNAKGFDCSASSGSQLIYEDEYGEIAEFTCESTGEYIASNSARLTSGSVRITNCNIFSSCQSVSAPHSIDIGITAEAVDLSGAEGAQVTSSTRILLRNY